MRVCVGLLAATAAGMAMALIAIGGSLGNPGVVFALALVAAAAEKGRVQVGERFEASITSVPMLLAAVLFGPLAAMLVAAVSLVDHFRRPYLKWATYTSTRSIAGAAAGLAALGARDFSSPGLTRFVVATLCATFVAEALDLISVAFVLFLRGIEIKATVGAFAPLQFVASMTYAPLVAGFIYAYNEVSGWTLLFFLGPALAIQRLYGMYQEQRRLAKDLALANTRLERANLSFATALVATLDARDRYTAGHSAAVAIYARDIAQRLGLSEEEQQLAHQCGLVHDIGKIGLPPGLLEKPGALTLSERRQMETHSEIGEGILAKVEDYAEIARIVRHHHERWDGQGYPDGIAELDIPLISRIISVADAYNAMTSDRPYRDAMPSRVARMRLAQGVESQFDTTIVAAFEAILAGADEEYRTGRRADFSLADQDVYSKPKPAAPAAVDGPEQQIADVA
jgi:putative nucleotidyltransferase with HDIG domain